MAGKTLIETNPYLRNPEKRKKMLFKTVSSSTAIETGYTVKIGKERQKRVSSKSNHHQNP
jgi:hypothetical protein